MQTTGTGPAASPKAIFDDRVAEFYSLRQSPTQIILFGTCDTKLSELLYLRTQLLAHPNISVLFVDVSVGDEPPPHEHIDVTSKEVLALHPDKAELEDKPLSTLARGERIKHMAQCMQEYIKRQVGDQSRPCGIISAGGSGNTSLAAEVMRDSLPLGFPKLIVSTVASGDTGAIVGESDITLMPSVVDVAGLNSLLKKVLDNAAGAIAGMAQSYRRREVAPNAAPALFTSPSQQGPAQKTRIGITMFGVTTPAVTAIQKSLSAYPVEVFVFHATGHGGKAMERLIREGGLDAVVDLTTTEICDHICGGNMSAGPDRLAAACAAGIPCVLSLGATDMVNFGPMSTVLEKYKGRLLYEHNSFVTLMRTDEDECAQIGDFIAEKLKEAKDPKVVQVWVPEGAVSAISGEGGPFENKKADRALVESLEAGLAGSGVAVVKRPEAINDQAFAHGVVEALLQLLGLEKTT